MAEVLVASIGLLVGLVLVGAVVLRLRKRTVTSGVAKAVVAAVLGGVVLGSSATAVGFMAFGDSDDDPSASVDRTVFRSIPLPNQEPPALSDVRFQDSPTNGLEVYFQQGQELFMTCVAMPDQLAIGSCTSDDATTVRTEEVPDGRTLTIARLKVLDEDRSKVEATISAADAEKYWSTIELSADPTWLKKYL